MPYNAYAGLGIPDLPLRAFQPRSDGQLRPQGGGKGSAPEPPDYEAAARETAAGNLEAARYATQANRPTQVTPWGTLSWERQSSFDQAGYDKAMAEYQAALSRRNNPAGAAASAELGPRAAFQALLDNATNSQQNAGPAPVAPDRNAFMNQSDNWTQTVTLSPEMQALFDQQNQLQRGLFGTQDAALQRVQQSLGQPFDPSGLPQATPGDYSALIAQLAGGQGGNLLNIGGLPGMGAVLDPGSLGPAGQVYDPSRATNNATELLMRRINPEMDQRQAALQTQLANQGVLQGSAAYNAALNEFGQQRNDAQNQAALAGINLGMQQQGLTFQQQEALRQMGAALQAQQFNQATSNRQLSAAEQAQLYGQQMGNAQLQAALAQAQFAEQMAARNNAFQEQSYLRSLPLNELNALRTGNQVGMPQFQGFGQQATTAGPDILGAAGAGYNAALGAYNAEQAGAGNMMSGILGLGGSLLGGAGAAGGFGKLFSF